MNFKIQSLLNSIRLLSSILFLFSFNHFSSADSENFLI